MKALCRRPPWGRPKLSGLMGERWLGVPWLGLAERHWRSGVVLGTAAGQGGAPRPRCPGSPGRAPRHSPAPGSPPGGGRGGGGGAAAAGTPEGPTGSAAPSPPAAPRRPPGSGSCSRSRGAGVEDAEAAAAAANERRKCACALCRARGQEKRRPLPLGKCACAVCPLLLRAPPTCCGHPVEAHPGLRSHT